MRSMPATIEPGDEPLNQHAVEWAAIVFVTVAFVIGLFDMMESFIALR
jgi:hypothetical protein